MCGTFVNTVDFYKDVVKSLGIEGIGVELKYPENMVVLIHLPSGARVEHRGISDHTPLTLLDWKKIMDMGILDLVDTLPKQCGSGRVLASWCLKVMT